ncbi:hypothetical protein SCHPADRAFT_259949 [Schizopora paradoxa]|uniref:Zn(2)-C6 fungal-type domain-containing protein n=1 Tax=Schizopora paradoxa TaxID=27342 RepID=A0A0H2SEP9_9AGAM|nr:hypothetical protein SCHPADRAFT_259949 [Schizopora paradoxa]
MSYHGHPHALQQNPMSLSLDSLSALRTAAPDSTFDESADEYDGDEREDDQDTLSPLNSRPSGSLGYGLNASTGYGFTSSNTSGTNNNSMGNGRKAEKEKQVRRRSSKACDQCRKSKCKCERSADSELCKSCVMLGTQCTFLGPSRKRGPPKGYIDAIESRLHQTEALVGIMLSLAYPEEGSDVPPDMRARSLLEDLRTADPLAREIVDRVDRGAYGTKGRRGASIGNNNAMEIGSGDEEGETSGKGKGKSSGSSSGPPPNVQGRGRMVELGQEMEMGGLSTAHPSNDWQDTVAERLKAAASSRSSTAGDERPKLSIYPPGSFSAQDHIPASATASAGPPGTDEPDRQRRRVDSTPMYQQQEPHQLIHHQSLNQLRSTHSPDRAARSSKGPHMHRHSISAMRPNDTSTRSPLTSTSASRFSPPVAPLPSSGATASKDGYNSNYNVDKSGASARAPSPMTTVSGSSEPEEDNEEGITDAVGQLSLNEEEQVRFHGKASGLHLLAQNPRADGRNRGGIWHFPKARLWPPAAPTALSSDSQAFELARAAEAEAVERAAIAHLPSKEMQKQLIELYFMHVHPYLPVLHKEDFLEDFTALISEDLEIDRGRSSTVQNTRNGASSIARTDGSSRSNADSGNLDRSRSSRIPTLLLFAIFAIAARYSPVLPGSPVQSRHGLPTDEAGTDVDIDTSLPAPPPGSMSTRGDGFLEHAKELLDRTYANSRPSTCQALLLMGYREIGIGAMAQSWLYIGMAVRMAQDLGMHRSSDRWQRMDGPLFNYRQQQVRKRIWYTCVVLDKYVSAYIGRPLSIFESDYDTQLPGVDELEETELWTATDPNVGLPTVPGRLLSCFNESARLSSILASVVQTIYAVKPVTSRQLEAVQLEQTLDRWYLDLPAHLRYTPGGQIPPANVLILHMQYWCTVLLLHRPFIRHYITIRLKQMNSPDSPIEPRAYSAAQKNFDLCVSAANHITSIISTYADNYCLKRAPVFLSYYIFTAGIMHLTTLTIAPSDPQASVGLAKCLDCLRKVEVVWPSATRAWELLHGAKGNIRDQEMVFAPISRPNKRSAEELSFSNQEHALGASQKNDGANLFTAPPPPATGFPSGTLENTGDEESPLVFFTSYDRWSSDNSLPFHSGLSTSVLPQQYSTGFADARAAQADAQRHTPMVDHPGSGGRYPQFWNDYTGIGQPSSMLSSMYGMTMMPQTAAQQPSAPQDASGQQQQQQQQLQQPMFMNNQFNLFGPPV